MGAMETPTGRRVIEVRQRVVGPTEPRLKVLRPRKLSDYPVSVNESPALRAVVS